MSAIALRRQHQARQHALVVKKDRAGPARPLIAALLRAGQAEVLAQRVQQGHAAVQMQPPHTPVDAQRQIITAAGGMHLSH